MLRDGKKIGTKVISEVNKQDLVKMMIGREEKIESFRNKILTRAMWFLKLKT